MSEGSLACAMGVHQSMNRVILAKQPADLTCGSFSTNLNMEHEKLQMFVYNKCLAKKCHTMTCVFFNQSTF